ncbi:putative ABC transport system permease protein [Thermomonospora echinospora]|uniref:Putative ABC transport system permease protein n=1 Tax=Thermomonospora echinospora TaxID=1992 RepID=A0A1H6C8H9_9ACTN|nr:FtsX-like permease family protein [Thermomonospora echinospora]SEG69280.1 putative ABC transport system permease protein [Thermomonospora echinospora]
MIGLLALATLRARKAAFAGSFLALLCAATLVGACGVLLETGLRGGIPTERYAGTPVMVAADQSLHWTKHKKDKAKVKSKPLTERAWLPESVAGRLRSVPGAAAIVAEVTFPATVVERAGKAPSWGHAWDSARLTPYTLREGRPPTAPGEVVLDQGRVGEEVTIQATDAPARYRVVGVTRERLPSQTSVFFSAGEARRLARHDGQVTALGVLARPGVDTGGLARAVTAAVNGTGAKVHAGSARGPLEFRDADQARVMLISMGGALGGTSLLVAVLVVVGTFSLSIRQRQRELAVLRAVAATPRQVRAMIGREALAVGVLAAVPGAALGGPVVASWLRSRFVELGALPDTLALARSPFPVAAAVAVAATTAAAWIAARVSSRRTLRIRPTEALSDAATEPPGTGRVRAFAGLVALAAHVVLLVVLSGLDTEAAASPVTFLTVVVAAVAVALLGPWLTRATTAVLAVPLRLSRGPGFLAAANTRAAAGRLATVVTPMALAVAMTGTILFVQTTMGHAAQRQAEAGTTAGYALAGIAGVPDQAADDARRTPGVTAVTRIVHTTLRVGQDKYPAQGITPAGASATLDLDVRDGSLDRLTDGAVALSTTAAGHRNARIGDRIALTLGDGAKVTSRLVAVYERGLGFGDVTLPFDLVAAHVDRPLADTVLIKADPAAHTALAGLARTYPGLRVLDGDGIRAAQRDRQATTAQVNYLAMGLIIAFTAISLVNALAMATGDRLRELAALRLAGVTRRQVLRMLRWETLVLVLAGATTGTAIASATLTAFATGMTGTPSPYAPPLAYAGLVATVTALALAATALPARILLRTKPAEAIRARE